MSEREKARAAKQRYRARNKEKILAADREAQKRRREETPERVRESRRKYYERNKEKVKAANYAYREKNREWYREYSRRYQRERAKTPQAKGWALMKRYGISYDEYVRLLEAQGNACAICRTPVEQIKRLHVDHCHRTGKVRGVLCLGCNVGIAHLQDDPLVALRASEYLARHRKPEPVIAGPKHRPTDSIRL